MHSDGPRRQTSVSSSGAPRTCDLAADGGAAGRGESRRQDAEGLGRVRLGTAARVAAISAAGCPRRVESIFLNRRRPAPCSRTQQRCMAPCSAASEQPAAVGVVRQQIGIPLVARGLAPDHRGGTPDGAKAMRAIGRASQVVGEDEPVGPMSGHVRDLRGHRPRVLGRTLARAADSSPSRP